MARTPLIFALCVLLHASVAAVVTKPKRPWTEQVKAQQDDADRIIDALTKGVAKGQAFAKLTEFVDTVGHRLVGSVGGSRAEQYMLQRLAQDGLSNVHGEAVSAPVWVRNSESLTMLEPRTFNMNILGLGFSIGTGPNGITAEVLVVQTFDELRQRAGEAKGRIVVFNQQCDWAAKPTGCYGESVGYRSNGASEASKVGAVASLVRSVTPYSIGSPHTGNQRYQEGVTPIPTAAITVEDALAMQRMQDRGQKIVVRLIMEAQNLPNTTVQTIVAEWPGSTYPDEIVAVGGHFDSWDVGTGAMDDAGGCVISWQILSTLRQLNMRPKRTLRVVMWAAEEIGIIGGNQYFEDHRSEASKMDIVMESDMGAFKPKGIKFTGNAEATQVMQNVVGLLARINSSTLYGGGGEADNSPWGQVNVPLGAPATENDRYFYYHHSHGDQANVLDPDDLDLVTAAYAVTAYTIANLDDMLPRDPKV